MRIGMDARVVGRGLGIATYVSELTRALVARDDVQVFWLGNAGLAPVGTTAVAAVARWPYPLLDLTPGSYLARRLGLDLLHFAGNTGWTRQGPVPFVLTIHDLIFFHEHMRNQSLRQLVGHSYERWIVPRAVRAAGGLVAVSAVTAAAVEQRFGRSPTVLPHGVEIPRGCVSAQDRSEHPYLVAFGARDPRKGLDLALRVFRAARPDVVRLDVVARAGVPPDFFDAAAEELREGAVVIHRSLSRVDLDRLIGGALALVYLSRSEGFGLPVVEAMAVGTPVITGVAPATREVGGEAALLVDPADPVRTTTEHVRRLSSDPALRTSVSAAGLAKAQRHRWEDVAARHVAIYERALN